MSSKVTRIAWWMALYGGSTPKHHYGWSNHQNILKVDKGKLVGWKSKGVRTVEQYRDKTGKRCWKGTPQLKKSEPHGRKRGKRKTKRSSAKIPCNSNRRDHHFCWLNG